MSGAGHQLADPFAEARAARAEAAEWLERRENDDWSGQDQAALDEWLGASWQNTSAYWRLEAAWRRADRLGALRNPNAGAAMTIMRTWPWMMLARSAAVLAVAAILGLGAYRWVWTPRVETYSTPVGGRELLTLSDGTQIELNTNTVLRVSGTREARQVWLDRGEAFFDVRHDPNRLFVVNAGASRIIDLGTKFSAERNGARTEVALLEGRARIESAHAPGRAKVLAPGDVAVATATAVSVTQQSAQDLADRLSWQRGMLVFRHATLADAAAAFNRYNNVKIVIADSGIASLTINGTFPTTSIALFYKAAQEAFGLHVESREGELVITR